MTDPSYKKIDNYYYDPTKPIGKGTYATVFKAFDEKTNDPVAVKVIHSSKFLESDSQLNMIMSEVNILRSLQGEHIVRLIDVKRTLGNLYIFMDFCDGNDLEKKLRSKYPFTEEEALTIIKQIAHAFVTLENSDILTSSGRKAAIMHRDIKPANLLFHQGKAKVADFGFSKIVDDLDKNTKSAHTLLGTPLYMAPQILNDEQYTVKCDVWSTGLVLYEILFGRLPWTGHSIPNLYMNIKSKPLTFPKAVSDETKDLITKMLSQKEETRLPWREVYEHPALQKIVLSTEPAQAGSRIPEEKQNTPQKSIFTTTAAEAKVISVFRQGGSQEYGPKLSKDSAGLDGKEQKITVRIRYNVDLKASTARNGLRIEVSPSESVWHLKQKFEQESHTTINPCYLYYEDVYLKMDRTLQDYGITDGAEILVFKHPKGTAGEEGSPHFHLGNRMETEFSERNCLLPEENQEVESKSPSKQHALLHIKVEFMHENSVTSAVLHVEKTTSIEEIREMINDIVEGRSQDYVLYFGQIPLEGRYTVEHYGLKDETSIQAVGKIESKGKANWGRRHGHNRALTSKNLVNKKSQNLKEIYKRENRIRRLGTGRLVSQHKDDVFSATITNDCKYIISASSKGVIKIFNYETQQEMEDIKQTHERSLTALSTSLDSKYVVCGFEDGLITVFDIATRNEVFRLYTHDPIGLMIMSSDGRYIVTGSWGKIVKLISLETRQEVFRYSNTDAADFVALMCDGVHIYWLTDGFLLNVIEISTRKISFENPVGKLQDYGHKMAFSKDLGFVVCGKKNILSVIDTQTKETSTFDLASGKCKTPVHSVKISHDERFIFAIVNEDDYQSIKVIDCKSQQKYGNLSYLNKKSGEFSISAVSHDTRFIILRKESEIHVLDLQIGFSFEDLQSPETKKYDRILVTKDKKHVISATQEGSLLVLKNGVYNRIQKAHDKPISIMVTSNDDRIIVTACDEGDIKAFDISSLKPICQILNSRQTSTVSAMALTNDGKFIIAARGAALLKYDIKGVSQSKIVYNDEVTSITISNDNKYIIAGSNDGSIKVTNLETMINEYTITSAHTARVGSICVSNNSKYIISGCWNGSIKVFDFKAQHELHSFTANSLKNGISDLKIFNNNKYFISAFWDKSIKVFSLETMTEIYCFPNISLNGRIMSLNISDNDNEITFTTDDAIIRVIHIPFNSIKMFFASEQISPLTPTLADTDAILKALNSQHRNKLMLQYQDLQILPYNWNLLHLITLFSYSDIPVIASYSQFKVRSLVDIYNKTPLHYIIEQYPKDFTSANILLEYILDYLDDKTRSFFEYETTIQSLTSLFDFIIPNADTTLISRLLNLCFINTPKAFGIELPRFGEPLSKYIFSKTPTLMSNTQICTLGSDPISYFTNMFHLDYSPGSEDMFEKVLVLSDIDNEVVFEHPLIENFVDYLWKKTRYVRWSMGLLFSALMIMLSIYIGLNERLLALEIIILVVASMFLGIELLQMKALGRKYVLITWNWVDISHLSLVVAFIITRFANSDNYLAKAWMSTVIIIAGYLRWISYLRLFKTTRHLIEIITSIIKGTRGFMIILGFITLGFSLIFMEFYRYEGGDDKDYGTHLYETYNLLYANDDDSNYGVSQKLILALILFLFNVLLLNLLISIMGDVYQKVQDQHTLIDSLTRLEIILEGLIIMKVILPRRNETQEKGYLINCMTNFNDKKRSVGGKTPGVSAALTEEALKEINSLRIQATQARNETDLLKKELTTMTFETRKLMTALQNYEAEMNHLRPKREPENVYASIDELKGRVNVLSSKNERLNPLLIGKSQEVD